MYVPNNSVTDRMLHKVYVLEEYSWFKTKDFVLLDPVA